MATITTAKEYNSRDISLHMKFCLDGTLTPRRTGYVVECNNHDVQWVPNKNEAKKLFREAIMLEFLKGSAGLQTIAHTEKKTAERLEAKGAIKIVRYKKALWQVRLPD